MELMTIGKFAKAAGVNIQTIRFYERKGILLPQARRDSGYRLYDEGAVKKIIFIKNAQKLGFSLTEAAGLLKLKLSSSGDSGKVKRKVQAKLQEIQDKLKNLYALQKTLQNLIFVCKQRKTTDYCPILKCLERK